MCIGMQAYNNSCSAWVLDVRIYQLVILIFIILRLNINFLTVHMMCIFAICIACWLNGKAATTDRLPVFFPISADVFVYVCVSVSVCVLSLDNNDQAG